ncbi:MAG: aspartate aminotransferase family protein [bacterium]
MFEMSTEEAIKRDKQYLSHGWGYIPINVVKGLGSKFWDSEGKEYIDMLSQTAGVVGIGHCHPKVVAAVKEQADKSFHILTSFINDARTAFSEKLAAVAPGKLKNNCKMYISSGGSEANEVALKMAMISTGKNEVISTYFSYHGGTLAELSLLGQSYSRVGPWPRFPGFQQIPNAYCYRCYFGQKGPDHCNLECAEALRYAIKYGSAGNVAAFIQEPVPGNGGHMVPPKRYFKRIREICDENDVLYILDEVQTGVGRSGKWWAAEYFDVEPDIFVTSKAIGGGMPVAATVIRNGLLPEQLIDDQWHIFTFGGSPISCAAGAATIDVVNEEKLPEKAARQGERLSKRLNEMMATYESIGDVRSMGLFIGVEIVKDKATKEPWFAGAGNIFGLALSKGALFGTNGSRGNGNVIKLKPPLVLTDAEADKALDILEESIAENEKSL